MKKVLLITLAIMIISFTLYAQNAMNHEMNKSKPGDKQMEMKNHDVMGMHKDMMKELNLTKEQQKKIDAMQVAHKKFMNTKQAEMKNLQIDKKNAMKAEEFNKVKQINKSIADLELEISNKQADHHQAMLKELTPEQKEKMQNMRPMGKPGMKKEMMQNRNMKEPCMGNCD